MKKASPGLINCKLQMGNGGPLLSRPRLKRGSKTQGDLCQVCQEEASGVYFGALVCLPCKSFYIRCNKMGNPRFSCSENGNCDVLRQNRLRCQYCRYQRCLNAGMNRIEKPEKVEAEDGQELCKICGDISNGIHFGVYTCEGCKKFYRRGLKEAETYVCQYSRKCVINPRNRNVCRFCRFQKCLDVGMSREGIKMGRPKKIDPEPRVGQWVSVPLIDHGMGHIGGNTTTRQPVSGLSLKPNTVSALTNKPKLPTFSSCMLQNDADGVFDRRSDIGGDCSELSGALGIRQLKRPMFGDPPDISWSGHDPLPPIAPTQNIPCSANPRESGSPDLFDPLPAFNTEEMETFLESLQDNPMQKTKTTDPSVEFDSYMRDVLNSSKQMMFDDTSKIQQCIRPIQVPMIYLTRQCTGTSLQQDSLLDIDHEIQKPHRNLEKLEIPVPTQLDPDLQYRCPTKDELSPQSPYSPYSRQSSASVDSAYLTQEECSFVSSSPPDWSEQASDQTSLDPFNLQYSELNIDKSPGSSHPEESESVSNGKVIPNNIALAIPNGQQVSLNGRQVSHPDRDALIPKNERLASSETKKSPVAKERRFSTSEKRNFAALEDKSFSVPEGKLFLSGNGSMTDETDLWYGSGPLHSPAKVPKLEETTERVMYEHIPADEANFIFDYTTNTPAPDAENALHHHQSSLNVYESEVKSQKMTNYAAVGVSNQLKSSFATFYNQPYAGGNQAANRSSDSGEKSEEQTEKLAHLPNKPRSVTDGMNALTCRMQSICIT